MTPNTRSILSLQAQLHAIQLQLFDASYAFQDLETRSHVSDEGVIYEEKTYHNPCYQFNVLTQTLPSGTVILQVSPVKAKQELLPEISVNECWTSKGRLISNRFDVSVTPQHETLRTEENFQTYAFNLQQAQCSANYLDSLLDRLFDAIPTQSDKSN